MRRTHIAAAVAVAVLTAAPGAHAGTRPTDAQLLTATRTARAYWHGNPPCGAPGLTEGAALPLGELGAADFAECRIMLGALPYWREAPALLCTVIVHEWGHLVLGPKFFAAVNPTDPAHDPNPDSIMHDGGPVSGSFPPCEASAGEHDRAAASTHTTHTRRSHHERKGPEGRRGDSRR